MRECWTAGGAFSTGLCDCAHTAVNRHNPIHSSSLLLAIQIHAGFLGLFLPLLGHTDWGAVCGRTSGCSRCSGHPAPSQVSALFNMLNRWSVHECIGSVPAAVWTSWKQRLHSELLFKPGCLYRWTVLVSLFTLSWCVQVCVDLQCFLYIWTSEPHVVYAYTGDEGSLKILSLKWSFSGVRTPGAACEQLWERHCNPEHTIIHYTYWLWQVKTPFKSDLEETLNCHDCIMVWLPGQQIYI